MSSNSTAIDFKKSLYLINHYDEAIRIDPKYSKAYYNRGVKKYDLGDKEGAEKDKKKAFELDPRLKELLK